MTMPSETYRADYELLFETIRSKNCKKLRTLFRRGAATAAEKKALANATREDGCTILHVAARHSNCEGTRLLLEHDANVDAQHPDSGRTPLHSAIQADKIDIVGMLLEHGADPNIATWYGVTPLMLSISTESCPSRSISRLLLKYDAQFCRLDSPGWPQPPLILAAELASVKTIRDLCQAGADVHEGDEDGCTPLLVAAKLGRDDVASVVIDLGSDVNACDAKGLSVLHTAVINCTARLVQKLLQAGANIHAKDMDGNTPLACVIRQAECAACCYCKKALRMAAVLLRAGASTEYTNGRTLLHLSYGKEMTELLAKAGADVHARDGMNNTALHVASRWDDAGKALALLAAGADPNAVNDFGKTPLTMNVEWDECFVSRRFASARSAEDDHCSRRFAEDGLGHGHVAPLLVSAGAQDWSSLPSPCYLGLGSALRAVHRSVPRDRLAELFRKLPDDEKRTVRTVLRLMYRVLPTTEPELCRDIAFLSILPSSVLCLSHHKIG